MANVEGKATAITVLTPVKREGPLVLWAVFWAGRHIRETLKKLEQLSFIHYARWAVIDRFPGETLGGTVVAAAPSVAIATPPVAAPVPLAGDDPAPATGSVTTPSLIEFVGVCTLYTCSRTGPCGDGAKVCWNSRGAKPEKDITSPMDMGAV